MSYIKRKRYIEREQEISKIIRMGFEGVTKEHYDIDDSNNITQAGPKERNVELDVAKYGAQHVYDINNWTDTNDVNDSTLEKLEMSYWNMLHGEGKGGATDQTVAENRMEGLDRSEENINEPSFEGSINGCIQVDHALSEKNNGLSEVNSSEIFIEDGSANTNGEKTKYSESKMNKIQEPGLMTHKILSNDEIEYMKAFSCYVGSTLQQNKRKSMAAEVDKYIKCKKVGLIENERDTFMIDNHKDRNDDYLPEDQEKSTNMAIQKHSVIKHAPVQAGDNEPKIRTAKSNIYINMNFNNFDLKLIGMNFGTLESNVNSAMTRAWQSEFPPQYDDIALKEYQDEEIQSKDPVKES